MDTRKKINKNYSFRAVIYPNEVTPFIKRKRIRIGYITALKLYNDTNLFSIPEFFRCGATMLLEALDHVAAVREACFLSNIV